MQSRAELWEKEVFLKFVSEFRHPDLQASYMAEVWPLHVGVRVYPLGLLLGFQLCVCALCALFRLCMRMGMYV